MRVLSTAWAGFRQTSGRGETYDSRESRTNFLPLLSILALMCCLVPCCIVAYRRRNSQQQQQQQMDEEQAAYADRMRRMEASQTIVPPMAQANVQTQMPPPPQYSTATEQLPSQQPSYSNAVPGGVSIPPPQNNYPYSRYQNPYGAPGMMYRPQTTGGGMMSSLVPAVAAGAGGYMLGSLINQRHSNENYMSDGYRSNDVFGADVGYNNNGNDTFSAET